MLRRVIFSGTVHSVCSHDFSSAIPAAEDRPVRMICITDALQFAGIAFCSFNGSQIQPLYRLDE